MALAARVERFLTRKGISYREFPIDQATSLDAAVMASGLPQDDFIQATLLIDITGVMMAVHKFDSALDPDALYQLTGRRLQPLTARQTMRLFGDCDPGFTPPVAQAYDLPLVVDEDVMQSERAVFSSGTADSLIELEGSAVGLALAGGKKGRLVIRGSGNANREALTLEELDGMTAELAANLRENNIKDSEDVAELAIDELMEYEGVDEELAGRLIMAARAPWFT